MPHIINARFQINKKLIVPYNDPDSANSRIEAIDDYVAFGAASPITNRVEQSNADGNSNIHHNKRRTLLANLGLRKKNYVAQDTDRGGSNSSIAAPDNLGQENQEQTYGFEPDALNFVLTVVNTHSASTHSSQHFPAMLLVACVSSTTLLLCRLMKMKLRRQCAKKYLMKWKPILE